jgi:hypothetical protein
VREHVIDVVDAAVTEQFVSWIPMKSDTEFAATLDPSNPVPKTVRLVVPKEYLVVAGVTFGAERKPSISFMTEDGDWANIRETRVATC